MLALLCGADAFTDRAIWIETLLRRWRKPMACLWFWVRICSILWIPPSPQLPDIGYPVAAEEYGWGGGIG